MLFKLALGTDITTYINLLVHKQEAQLAVNAAD